MNAGVVVGGHGGAAGLVELRAVPAQPVGALHDAPHPLLLQHLEHARAGEDGDVPVHRRRRDLRQATGAGVPMEMASLMPGAEIGRGLT